MVPVHSSATLILPESRLRDRLKGVVRGLFMGVSINWCPVFCANCAKPHGYVPEENMTFAFWLCDECAEKWGPHAGLMLMPDQVFWRKVMEEQLDKHGRLLTEKELQAAADSPCTALGKLIREGI